MLGFLVFSKAGHQGFVLTYSTYLCFVLKQHLCLVQVNIPPFVLVSGARFIGMQYYALLQF